MNRNKLISSNNSKITNTIKLIILSALCIVFFYPPYLQGLFFEKHQLPAEILVFSLFILFLVYKYLNKDYSLLKTPIEYIAIGFIVIYLFSIFSAVHTRSAIMEVLKYCMYFAVFFMVTEMVENVKIKTIFLWTIIVSAVGVSVIGLSSAMGGTMVTTLNRFFAKLGVEGDLFFGLFVEGRVNSTLQYPNALASYVMAVFFIVIGLLLSEGNVWMKALYGVYSYILFLTFMLTKSRGAQILFPIAVIVFMVVAPNKTRIKAFFHILIIAAPATVVSLLILPYLSPDEFQKQAVILFTVGMLVSAFLAIIVGLISNFLQQIHWTIYTALLLVVVIILSLSVYHLVNASVPLELSHSIDEPVSSKVVARELSLPPGEYVLQFEAEASTESEQPYIYSVNISSRTINNILFEGQTTLTTKTYKVESENKQENIQFTVTEGNNAIVVSFENNYPGTGVVLQNVRIVDSASGKIQKSIILKNKYNLEILLERFQNIKQDKSGLLRVIFYKDGLKILRDRWILGGGGGAWAYLYRHYQSYGYVSAQAHNYPLQLGIETGISGLLLLLALITFLVLGYLRYKRNIKDKPLTELYVNTAIITAIAALFMHAVIDFDFSESAILLLFWQLIALFNREIRDSYNLTKIEPVKIIDKQTRTRIKLNITGGVLVTAIVLWFSISFYSASVNARQAFKLLQQSKTEEAVDHISKAIRKDRFNETYVLGYNPIPSRPDIKVGFTDILLMKIDLMQKKQDKGIQVSEQELSSLKMQMVKMNNLLEGIEEDVEYNLSLAANLSSYYFQTGNPMKGLEYLNHALQLSPFEPSLWQSKMNVYFELARVYYNKGEREEAEKYLDEGLNTIELTKEVNERNLNPFIVNSTTINVLQKMKYMKDYWGDTEKLNRTNAVLHYLIPNLDINLDQVPDQWISVDRELMEIKAVEQGIQVNSNGDSYLYTANRIHFEKGKSYSIEVQLDRSVEEISFSIANLTKKTTLKTQGNNNYLAEILVDQDPEEQGNRLILYLGTDCVIERIVLLERE